MSASRLTRSLSYASATTGRSTATAAHEEAVGSAFDRIAPTFDGQRENEITRRIRSRVYEFAERYAPSRGTILDINCGTGIDADELSRRGYEVVGADISRGMLNEARRKYHRRIRFVQCSIDRLSRRLDPVFQLVLSNFGGLNCIEDLRPAAREIAAVLKPGGHLLAVVLGTFSLWETAAYLSRWDIRGALRRRNGHARATGFGDGTFDVFYHSPRQFVSAFEPWFQQIEIRGLSVVSPPPQSTSFIRKHRNLDRILWTMDHVAGRLPLLRNAGDHYLVILRRTAA